MFPPAAATVQQQGALSTPAPTARSHRRAADYLTELTCFLPDLTGCEGRRSKRAGADDVPNEPEAASDKDPNERYL